MDWFQERPLRSENSWDQKTPRKGIIVFNPRRSQQTGFQPDETANQHASRLGYCSGTKGNTAGYSEKSESHDYPRNWPRQLNQCVGNAERKHFINIIFFFKIQLAVLF